MTSRLSKRGRLGVVLLVVLMGSIAAVLPLFLGGGQPSSAERIEPAIDRAIAFLEGMYSPEFLFDDPYILGVDQLPGTNASLRMLDIATIVRFFLPEEVRADPRLEAVVAKSDGILRGYLDQWKDAPFVREAIDLYGVFPYYYPSETKAMVEQIVSAMDAEGDWEPYDTHGAGFEWRKITDESWLVLAMARNRVDESIVYTALQRKASEAAQILDGRLVFSSTGMYYALAHLHLTFAWTAREGYDLSEYTALVDTIDKRLASMSGDSYLIRWTTIQAETLFWLAESSWGDPDRLNSLAHVVLDRQETDGGWRFSDLQVGEMTPSGLPITEANFNSGRSHTTLVAIAALSQYASLGSAAG